MSYGTAEDHYEKFAACFFGCIPYIKLHLTNNPTFITNDFVDFVQLRSQLNCKSGIYAFFNKTNNKQYIGVANNLYKRFKEHIYGDKSNKALQLALHKYGVYNFNFIVYEFINDTQYLINREDFYRRRSRLSGRRPRLSRFEFNYLYNFAKHATSLQGYIHSEEAKAKMRARLADKRNHPMFSKKHTTENFTINK